MRVGVLVRRPQLFVAIADVVARLDAHLVDIGSGHAADVDVGLIDWQEVGESAADQQVPAEGRGAPRTADAAGRWIPAARHLCVVSLPGEAEDAVRAARVVGAGHVVIVPTGLAWLEGQLVSEARLLAIAGVVGGVGASTLAIASALAMEDCLLIDADPDSHGWERMLGLDSAAAGMLTRIPATADCIDAASLRGALPRVEGITVATGWNGQRSGSLAERVATLVEAGSSGFAASVVDLGRCTGEPGWGARPQALVLVAPGNMAGAAALSRVLPEVGWSPVKIALRPVPWCRPGEAVTLLRRVLGHDVDPIVLPHLRHVAERADSADLLGGRLRRRLHEIGTQVWGAVDA